MPDIGRGFQGGEPSLDEIRFADDFIDALAAAAPVARQDEGDAALAALLGGWRDEMRWPPATGLISESQAVAALNAGLAEKPSGSRRENRADKQTGNQVTSINQRRNRRGLSTVGAVAAAALCIGGFGAVVSGAGPGDALYGLRTMLFGAPKQVRDDQVALAARSELTKVQELISQGDWQEAQEKLVAVSTQVASVGDEQQKQQLMDQFNDLSAKVVERDPEATAPPGIVYTVPPSATELVPAVAPLTTTNPSTPSPTDSTTPATTSAESSTTDSSEASSNPTSSGTAASTSGSATSSAPSTSAAASSSAVPSSTSSTVTAATTTPTSAVPTTSATPASTGSSAASTSAASTSAASTSTSSAAAAQATSTAQATTTVAPKSATPVTTTAPAATSTAAPAAEATTTAAPTTVSSTTVASTAVAQTPAAELPSSQPVTTTVLIPVPAG